MRNFLKHLRLLPIYTFVVLSISGCFIVKPKTIVSLRSQTPSASVLNFFGITGLVKTRISEDSVATDDELQAMTVEASGKTIVAGSTYPFGSWNANVILMRYNIDGTLDTSFGTSGKVITDLGINSFDYINSLAVLANGKILASGYTDTLGSGDVLLLRYNSDGSLDSSFGTAGVVITDVAASSDEDPGAFTIQSDGKILVHGYTTSGGLYNLFLFRYNSDGSLDATFGTAGKVVTDIGVGSGDQGYGLAFQTDGKIVVTGRTNANGNYDVFVIRYNSDGSLDASFGTGGKVITNVDFNDEAKDIDLQADGKILVTGTTTTIGGASDILLIRYNDDGSLDPTFGTGGVVSTDVGVASGDSAYKLALQADGKILVEGYTDANASANGILLRYNADGSLDASFGTGGKVIIDSGTNANDSLTALNYQPSGIIKVAGYSYINGLADSFVVSFNSDGSRDTSFGSSGQVFTDVGASSTDTIYSTVIQPDYKILAAGQTNAGGSNNFFVTRHNSDGTLDSSFGSLGKVVTDVGVLSDDDARALTLQTDGKILVTGFSNTAGSFNVIVIRYNSDGSLDTSFGTAGKVITDIGANSNDKARDITLQTDGKILVTGTSNASGLYDPFLIRYNSDGSLDAGFGIGGKVTTDVGTNSNNEYAYALAFQADGKVLVSGSTHDGVSYNAYLIRYNSNGSLDASFGAGGIITTDIGTNSHDYIEALDLQSDGKIIVTGYTNANGTNDIFLARYNGDGSLDASFGAGGKVITDAGIGSSDYSKAVAIQNDGKILVTGYTNANGTNDAFVIRYNSDGTLDSSFGTGGKVIKDIATNTDDYAYAIALQSDGKIFIGGTTDYDLRNMYLLRLNSDGSL